MSLCATMDLVADLLTPDFEDKMRATHVHLTLDGDVRGLWDFLFAVFLKLGAEHSVLLDFRNIGRALKETCRLYPQDAEELMAVPVLTGQKLPPWQLLAAMMAHIEARRAGIADYLQKFLQQRNHRTAAGNMPANWKGMIAQMQKILERERKTPEPLPFVGSCWIPSATYPTVMHAQQAGAIKVKRAGPGKRGKLSQPPKIPEPCPHQRPFDWLAWKANRGRKEFGAWAKPLLIENSSVSGFAKQMHQQNLISVLHAVGQMLRGEGKDYWTGPLMEALLREIRTEAATVMEMYRSGQLA